MDEKINWCIEQHRKTNHFYDTYLPYEFHLRMVVEVCKEWLPKIGLGNYPVMKIACWGHDLIEDTRCSYNQVRDILGSVPADMIYAVTNEKGKNRKERANEKYYEGIKETLGATFVKLCDRIANVQYSKLTKSKMFEMYKKENPQFVQYLYQDMYKPMFDYLDTIFTTQ
jgi:(p)ppGpp synthase/HD superfamily hydrolase